MTPGWSVREIRFSDIVGGMKRNSVLLILLVLVVVSGCTQNEPENPPEAPSEDPVAESMEPLSVFVVNYPLGYFAERIGGDLVRVSFPAPADEDPAYWAPGPEVVVEYQRADLILLNGVGYAKWLERATLPAGKLVNTSAGFEDRWIPLEEGPVHTHGLQGEHSHKGYAFTTWLDPQLAIEQARAIGEALVGKLPGYEAQIQTSLDALIVDLQQLDSVLESETRSFGDQPLLFSHPVYQYFVARYGLNARAVHWEPREEPSGEQLQELRSILADHPARWMIWEAEPLAATVQHLQELGIESVVYEPGANRPGGGDLLTVMQANAVALRSIDGQK